MNALLEFRNVDASYKGAQILRSVSFEIGEQETVGLVGRNGAGKTTALLSVFKVPTVSGEILFEGEPLTGGRFRPASRGISLVPQGKRIFPNLTVQENILLGRASKRSSRWDLDSIFDIFPNLARGATRLGTALSGGEQQMLAIARALVSGPKILMLDEPTEGLAPVIIDQVIAALAEIQKTGTALLLVEQHISMIQKLAATFVGLRKGEVAVTGEVSQLQSRQVQETIAL